MIKTMPKMKDRTDSSFTGIVRLRRFTAPPLIRGTLMWEYEEPFRLGRATIWHIPGVQRSWLRGRWDAKTAKDYDDHDQIQRHLLDAMQARARGYFIGKDGVIDPIGDSSLVR